MMTKPPYHIALRAMKGEFESARLVEKEFLSEVFHRFIIRPPSEQKSESCFSPSMDEIVSNTANFVGKNWSGRGGCLDIQYLLKEFGDVESSQWVARIFKLARSYGAVFAPVIALNDLNPQRLAAFQSCIQKGAAIQAVIRIDVDLMFGSWLASIAQIMGTLDLDNSRTIIVLDFPNSDTSSDQILSDISTGGYHELRTLGNWRQVVMQASNFPSSKSSEIGKTKDYLRTEWLGWLLARKEVPELVYGDYGPDSSRFEFRKSPGGIAHRQYRYTTENHHNVIRGIDTGSECSAMQDVALRIVEGRLHSGRHFSMIDDFIFRVSRGCANPGRASDWRATNIAHHIARVIRDLKDLRGATHPDFAFKDISEQAEFFSA